MRLKGRLRRAGGSPAQKRSISRSFVVFGGLLAWWAPRLRWVHLAAVAYGAGIVSVGWSCPLTEIERALWNAGGETAPTHGFVDRFLEGVIYPGDLTSSMRVLAGLTIAASWTGLLWRNRRKAAHPPRVAGGVAERTTDATRCPRAEPAETSPGS